jgi:hypothetical protein
MIIKLHLHPQLIMVFTSKAKTNTPSIAKGALVGAGVGIVAGMVANSNKCKHDVIQNKTTRSLTLKKKDGAAFDTFKDCTSTEPTLSKQRASTVKPGETLYLSKGDYTYKCSTTWFGWHDAPARIGKC